MKKIFFAIMLAAAHCVVPVSSYAQLPAGIVEKDAAFLSEWIAINTYELMLTRMAAAKALSAELRNSAGKMNNHHQRTDAELTAYANRFNISIDPDKREKYVAKVEKWDKDAVSGEWDKDIVEELVDVHKKSVDMLKEANEALKDNELKDMAAVNLPVLQRHLDELIPLKERIKRGEASLAANPAIDRTNAADEIPEGNEKDAKFLSDLRLMNDYELQLMEIILKKGSHRALKNAAQRMLEDHSKLRTRVDAYAKKKMYGNDPDEASKTIEKVNKWRQKKGGMEWDADIIEELIDAHKDGIDMLEDAVTDVRDEELRAIMKETIPSMKKHYAMLEPLKETVKKPWKDK